jgi:hypothetical protein
MESLILAQNERWQRGLGMQVEREADDQSSESDSVESGERVSNAWVICPQVGDNSGKPGLIPDVFVCRMADETKVGILLDLPLGEGPASHQFVGRVTAYQGIRVAGLRG